MLVQTSNASDIVFTLDLMQNMFTSYPNCTEFPAVNNALYSGALFGEIKCLLLYLRPSKLVDDRGVVICL